MSAAARTKACGLACGLGLFVAIDLSVLTAAERATQIALLKEGSFDPAVVAPAEQLSRAFTMVANHVKPAVVSVYSEKQPVRRLADEVTVPPRT